MTRSITALSRAAMLAALVLPAVAAAQDTSSTGGRVIRDSAAAHQMNSIRFDTTQAVSITGVTIVRIDSLGAGNGADHAGVNASGTRNNEAGSMGSMHAPTTMHGGMNAGQNLSAVVRTGSDSMRIVLGPADYLASKQLVLSAGDVIDVKGVRLPAGPSGTGDGMSGSAMGRATTSGSTTGMGMTGMGTTGMGTAGSTEGAGATGATVAATGTNAAMTTILATEITRNSITVSLRDRTTGEPNWGMMGSDAASNRRSMTRPPSKKDSSTSSRTRKP